MLSQSCIVVHTYTYVQKMYMYMYACVCHNKEPLSVHNVSIERCSYNYIHCNVHVAHEICTIQKDLRTYVGTYMYMYVHTCGYLYMETETTPMLIVYRLC